MLNLDDFSSENLERINQALKIILESWQLKPSKQKCTLIPIDKFEKIGLSLNESYSLIKKIEQEENGAIRYMAFKLIKNYGKDEQTTSLLARSYQRNHPITIKNLGRVKEIYSQTEKKLKEIQFEKDSLRFDPLNGVFYCGSKNYKIRSKIRFALAKKLWQERKTIDNKEGKVIEKGCAFPKEALLRNLELSSLAKNGLLGEIKELNRIFRKKKFPAHIETKNGVLLVIKI